MAKQLTPQIIQEWLIVVSGKFNVRDIWAEIGIATPEGRHHLRVILSRLEEKGIVVNLGAGNYRKKDASLKPVDWQSADTENWLPILFPFDIHAHAKLYGKSIVIVAGGKNDGKTTFILESVKLNAGGCVPVDLYNSETGREQLKQRLAPLNFPNPAPFSVYERYDNFADVIHPDHWSFIDYLDFNSEVYLVGTEIDNIFRKLGPQGVAVIGIQKPPPAKTLYRGQEKLIERDLAYGGAFTAKRAVLYISLSFHKLKLVYVKTPMNPRVNPNNMQWSFDFDEDGYFTNIQRYYGEQQQGF